MATRALEHGMIEAPPAPPVTRPPPELATATALQVRVAKEHVARLAAHQAYIQQHRDELEAQLATMPQDEVDRVKVRGYPAPKSYR